MILGNLIELDASDSSAQQLQNLFHAAESAAVLNNGFYQRWLRSQLQVDQFELFAANYAIRVEATVSRLGAMFVTLTRPDDRIELWHNIGDELGHGDANRVHAKLFRDWAADLQSRLIATSETPRLVVGKSSVLPSTHRFVESTLLMCQRDEASAVGALLAQEWHGYRQIAVLLDGFQNYRPLYGAEDFHDSAEYFYVHLGRAEKEHRVQALTIAARAVDRIGSMAPIKAAFFDYLDQLNSFWEGLDVSVASMQRDRQPV